MTETTGNGASYTKKDEAEQSAASYVKMWMDALKRAEDEEKDWVKKAEKTAETYRGKEKSRSRTFNILHSNVETLCPALYNSTPVPDVRRRFADNDPVGKAVADLLERSLSFSIDNYDFDTVMRFVVRDGEIVGRGVPRVRYVPTFAPIQAETGSSPAEEQAQPSAEEVVYEEVTCDYVPWRYFRRGPGRTWKDVPWVAFGDFLTLEELERLSPKLAAQVPLNYSSDQRDGYKKIGKEEMSIFRRALVWQIWDKEGRKVISICPEFEDSPLATVDDPLGLVEFFPVPRPYQPVIATDSLTPVVPYELYEDLVAELNDITVRISKLVKQLRPRGGYGGNANDIKAISEAGDGELVPLTDVDALVMGSGAGGIDKAITWFPMDPTVKALQQLVQQRTEVKQIIYEVTGIADILRGATDPNETLGAQQLKAQWGSLRIQDRQSEVARVARDLLRLKSEIIASKFAWQTLTQMTGLTYPTQQEKELAQSALMQAEQMQQASAAQGPGAPPAPQPQGPSIPPEQLAQAKEIVGKPSREEVEKVLRSDVSRRYRIDIESDSTIRGDLARNQKTMAEFLQGTAQYAAAMGPIVQLDRKMLPVAIEVFAAFSRQFKLGKQAEDALDALSDTAKSVASAPQDEPNPEMEKLKIEQEGQKQKLAFEKESHDQKMAFEADRHKNEMDFKREGREMERQDNNDRAQREFEFKKQHEGDKLAASTKPTTNVNFDANKALEGVGPALVEAAGKSGETVAQAAALMAQAATAMTQSSMQVAEAVKVMAAPKRIVRDKAGKAVGTEAVMQ